jgi:hypothetical protein
MGSKTRQFGRVIVLAWLRGIVIGAAIGSPTCIGSSKPTLPLIPQQTSEPAPEPLCDCTLAYLDGARPAGIPTA